MKKYRCNDCGRIFDEDEIATWNESRGEFWGQPCYETMSGCPYCHSGDLDEYDPDAIDDDEEEDQDEREADK